MRPAVFMVGSGTVETEFGSEIYAPLTPAPAAAAGAVTAAVLSWAVTAAAGTAADAELQGGALGGSRNSSSGSVTLIGCIRKCKDPL